jgi:integrase
MALYKRGNIWWMSFQIDGRHVQRSTKCRNKRDAETYERGYRTQLAKGEVGIKAKVDVPSFKKAVAEYLTWAEVEHDTKPNTLRSYRSTSVALLKFYVDRQLDEIRSGDVEKFKQWRSAQSTRPRRRQHTKVASTWKPTRLKPATINRELALLRIIFNFFIRNNIIVRNPVSGVRFLKEDNGQTRLVSAKEEKLYLMAASQPLQDFATVMVDTGMRPEEVARIERKNVNLDQGFVFIPFGKTKAAKRKIPLTDRVGEILRKRLQVGTGSFVFESDKTGGPLTTLKTAHSGALRRALLAPFRLYDLRHTFATRFIESGGDIVTLQALLGHSNIQMVTRYAHPTEKHQFEAMKRMEQDRLRKEVQSKAKGA